MRLRARLASCVVGFFALAFVWAWSGSCNRYSKNAVLSAHTNPITATTLRTHTLFSSVETNDQPSTGVPTTIMAVIHVRLYAEDKAKLTRVELRQWIKVMRWAGVDDVVLYDNGMDKSEQVLDLCEELGVRYHLWNERNSQDGKSTIHQWWAYKLDAYDHAAKHYQDYDWHIAFDMDEIPFAPEDQEAGYLRRILKEHATRDPSVSEWSFKNYIFVGHPSTTGPLYTRYVRRNNGPHNALNKPIYKPQCIKAAFHHNHLTCGTSKEFNASKMRMNHYWGGRLSNWGELSQSLMESTIEDTSILPMMKAIFI